MFHSLDGTLSVAGPKATTLWQKSPLQQDEALKLLYSNGLTYMKTNSSYLVLDKDDSLIVFNITCVTPGWM